MKKTSAVFMTTILGVALLLSGCGKTSGDTQAGAGGGSTAGSKPKVAVVLKALNSEYWKVVQRGAMDAGAKLGAEVDVMGPAAESEIEKQVSLIQDQITNNVNALVIAPTQPTTVLNVLQQAKTQKIPVVLADSDADYPEKVSFVGTENLDAGKEGGKYLAAKLKKGDKVAIIRGQLGSKTHDDRTNGAQQQLEAAGINVATVQPADSDRAKAMSVMENILQANSDIKAVFATNDDMALGALRALQEKKSSIMVVGFDGTSEALESLKSGGLTGDVAQDPYMIGYLGVEAAVKTIKGEKVEKRINSGAKVITKETAEELLKKIKEYTK